MYTIKVGSGNPVKIEAVKEVFAGYPFLYPRTILPCDVSSEIVEQPMGFQEIVSGAKNRAVAAYNYLDVSCNYGVGIESGLIEVSNPKSFLDVCACSIFDGEKFYLGFSEAFQIPPKVVKLIREKGLDLSQATREAGLTNSPKIGNEKGIISILSNGRFDRMRQIKNSLEMALISLENPGFYE